MTLLKSLFCDKQFTPFFWVLFLGAFNDNVIKNVLVIIIAYKGVELYGLSSQSLIALVGALFILPYMLFSPYAGSLSDKFNKVKVIRGVKWAELFIMLLAGVGFYIENYTLLIISVFLMGAQSTFFGPVKYSIPLELVKKKDISTATGYIELGTFLAILLGTLLAGYLSTVNSWSVIGLILVVISVLGILFSQMQPMISTQARSDIKLGFNVLGGHFTLFKVVLQQKRVVLATILISLFWFLGAGLLTVLPTFCKDLLGANEAVVTLFLAMFTLGIAFGSVIGAKLSNDRVEMGLVPLGALGILLFSTDLYWANQSLQAPSEVLGVNAFIAQGPIAARTLIDFFGISAFGGLFIVPLYAYIQEFSLNFTLSRVVAVNNIFNALFMVLVSVLIMVLTGLGLNAIGTLMVVSVVFFILSLLIFFSTSQFRDAFFRYFKISKH